MNGAILSIFTAPEPQCFMMSGKGRARENGSLNTKHSFLFHTSSPLLLSDFLELSLMAYYTTNFMIYDLFLITLVAAVGFGFVEMVRNGLWWQQEWLSLMDGMKVWIEWMKAVGWLLLKLECSMFYVAY